MSKKLHIKYDITGSSALRYTLNIAVRGEGTGHYMSDALNEIGKGSDIRGFRKGRATHMGVLAHYGQNRIREVAAEMIAQDAFTEISSSLEDKPLTPPEFDLPPFEPGEDYLFKATS